jgi:hypothetical protein
LLRTRGAGQGDDHTRYEKHLPGHVNLPPIDDTLLNPSSSAEISRIRNFWILPVTVIGNSSVNRT